MELWQEAYKAVEDIHNLMAISKKALQPKMMAQYYLKLALVFWKSGNQLFHAAAVRTLISFWCLLITYNEIYYKISLNIFYLHNKKLYLTGVQAHWYLP